MTQPAHPAPGRWCWPELATTDPDGAKAFYGALLGWSAFDVPSAAGNYTIFRLGDLDCAACYRLSDEQAGRGVPVHWQNYVKVLSADDAAARAKALGGSVTAGPFDVEGIGRMAVLKDPAGVGFSVWQDGLHCGIGTGFQTGAHCWTELMTRQPDQARAFYSDLFGWSPRESDKLGFTYIEFLAGGSSVGGLMPMAGAEWEGVPDHFMQYFTVADVAASVARAAQLGGGICVPPAPIPGVGSFAILNDPAGATFGVLQPEPRP